MAARVSSKKSAKKAPKGGKPGRARPRVKARRGARRPAEMPREIAAFDPDGVESVLDVMPDDETLQDAADRLQGLAHPSRLRALIALSVSELCVGDIAACVGLSLSATSTLLKQLRSLGFVATRSAGKQTYYRIASEVPAAVLEVLFAHADDEQD